MAANRDGKPAPLANIPIVQGLRASEHHTFEMRGRPVSLVETPSTGLDVLIHRLNAQQFAATIS
jgi:hypothetical protein